MLALSELGLRLKNAREEKKITLDELQNITKIQKRYLLAIEEGKLEMLPGQFYARAFVKSYSEAVGIDPELLFEEHASELPASNKQKEAEIPPRVQTRKTGGTKKTRRLLALLPSVVAVVFIISIFVGVWYFLQGNSVNNEGIPKNQVQSPVEGGRDNVALNPPGVEEEPEEEEVPEEEEPIEEIPEQELIVVETKGNETIYNLVNAEEFAFKVELQGKSYVGIDNRKGKTFHASNVDGGKSLTFDFSEEETIQFNFGASNNVNLFVNDVPFEFPQDIVHQKVTFHFQKDRSE